MSRDQSAENDAALVGRILTTGLHAFLCDLVDAGGRLQADIAREAGFSEKHVSQMLNGRVDGSLSAWSALLRAAHRPIPEGDDVEPCAEFGSHPRGKHAETAAGARVIPSGKGDRS